MPYACKTIGLIFEGLYLSVGGCNIKFRRSIPLAGVLDAGVVDGHEFVGEDLFGGGDVLEGDGAVVEVSFLDLAVDDAADEGGDAFFRVFGEASAGGFDGVAHHEDGLLDGGGVGSGIGEELVVDLQEGVVLLVFDVEVFGLALPVVGGDELADDFR